MKEVNRFIKLTLLILLISSFNAFAGAKTEVKELVCEYKINPSGIDIQKPRLSWQISTAEENILQFMSNKC